MTFITVTNILIKDKKKTFKKRLEILFYSDQIKTGAFQMVTSSNLQISHNQTNHFVHL